MNRSHRIALILFFVFYVFLAAPIAFLPSDVIGLLMYFIYLVMSLCVACDLTETVLSIAWGAPSALSNVESPRRDATAVLMVICDDSVGEALQALLPLANVGYSVYILDDSETQVDLPYEVSKMVRQVRRDRRIGAKAGNLNNWLFRFGTLYEHVIILDSDSRMSVSCADALLSAAAHPGNAHVALFQAKTRPGSSFESLFSEAIGAASRPRMRILERVHARLGVLLSAGHNLLLRLEPLRRLGGFDQTMTAEDTVLSLDLITRGWGIALVDVWSEDADPPTIAAYNRRTIRWARQTVELFSRPWFDTPYRLKLLIVRHLLNYLFPIFGTIMLLLTVWFGPSRLDQVRDVIGSALHFQHGFVALGVGVWTSILITALLPALRLCIAIAEGVALRELILGIFFSGANFSTLVLPLARGMVTSAIGKKVDFVPTNSRVDAKPYSVPFRREAGLSSLCLSAFLIAGLVKHPASALIGTNGIWLCCFILTPVVLHLLVRLRVMNAR